MKEIKITLNQMLDAREARSIRQKNLLDQYRLPLLCFTMNIAGEVKTSPLIKLAFEAGLEQVEACFKKAVYSEKHYCVTGPEAYVLLDFPAPYIKERCCGIEDATPVGRLYDLDVFDASGNKLSRGSPRTCIVCGRPAFACSRSREHGLDEICRKTNEILTNFAAEYLADTAVKALKEEACLTPKPGLVDMNNSGAHSDMDLELLCKSADSLRSYFVKAVKLGAGFENCMAELQSAGLEAENCMFTVTGGVNTHKGAIYGLGLLLAALGSCLSRQDNLFLRASALAKAGNSIKKHPRSGCSRQVWCARSKAGGGVGVSRRAKCHAKP
ncbi:MAG: citrate lyase holo-[acyl-carrier protein] synthase [Acetivibrionales bacterium]